MAPYPRACSGPERRTFNHAAGSNVTLTQQDDLSEGLVKSALSDCQTTEDETFDGVGRSFDRYVDFRPFVFPEGLKDVLGGRLTSGRPSDSDPDPMEVTGAERASDRPQPVVPV